MLRKYVFQENRLKSKDQIGKGTRRRKLDLFGLISSPWPPPRNQTPVLRSTPKVKKTNDTYNHHHHHYHLIKNGIWCALDQLFKTQKQPHFMPPHHDLDHPFPQIILFLLPCIQKFWVKGVQNKNIFDWRIHYPQCLSNLEAIGRKHFVKALPSEYSSSSTLRIFFSALPIFLIIFPQNIHLCPLNILLY